MPRRHLTTNRPWLAAVALAVGAGFIAEAVASTNTPSLLFLNPVVPLFFGLLYGPPAVLLREGWVRGWLGWPGALLFGAAFAALNEGVVANVWFAPNALEFTARAAGRADTVNWNLVAGLIVFHTFESLFISVALAQLTFQRIASQPWLRVRGVVFCVGVSLLLGITSILPKDGEEVANAPQRALALLGVVVLGVVAFAMPPFRPNRRNGMVGPSRRAAYLGGAGLVTLFVGLFFGLSAVAPAAVPAAMATLYVVVVLTLLRWTSWSGWSSRHTLALVAGALTPTMIVSLTRVVWLQPVSTGLFTWFLVRLDRRLKDSGRPSEL